MTNTAIAPYVWVITQDNLDMGLKGIRGPAACDLNEDEIRRHPKAEKFRLLDDDGEIYVYGYFVDLTGDADGFEPLDDYGKGGLGATEIQYRNTEGEYKTL
jgi:hypothetical protein